MTSINLQVKKTTYLNKVIGLIGKAQPEVLFFKTRFGIHTFGVRFPIEVVILNKTNQIMKMATVKPNSVLFWNPMYDGVLELPEGTIQEKHLQLGDSVAIDLL